MKRIVMAAALMAMAAPAWAQLQGREIDLNQKQGWIGREQAEFIVIEGPAPKGWGGWDAAPKGFPKPKEGSGEFKPEDQVTGYTDDPSERAADPNAKPQDGGAPPQDGNDDFNGDEQ